MPKLVVFNHVSGESRALMRHIKRRTRESSSAGWLHLVSGRLFECEEQIGREYSHGCQFADRGPGQQIPARRPIALMRQDFTAYPQRAAYVQQHQGGEHRARAIEDSHSGKRGKNTLADRKHHACNKADRQCMA